MSPSTNVAAHAARTKAKDDTTCYASNLYTVRVSAHVALAAPVFQTFYFFISSKTRTKIADSTFVVYLEDTCLA